MIRYPVELVRRLGIGRLVVVVSPASAPAVRELLGADVEYVVQPSALGTGDALGRAAEQLQGKVDHLLVLGADCPLLRADTVRALVESHVAASNDMTLLTGDTLSVGDLGRVYQDGSGKVTSIVEAVDDPESSELPGVFNAGVYCFTAPWLLENLERVEPSPTGERYLTSLAGIGAAHGAKVQGMAAPDSGELQGVNDRLQLAQVEAVHRQRIREHWMLAGVTMIDPASVFIDPEVAIGQDTVILPNTMLLGQTSIGEGCEIGPGSIIRDSKVGDRCRVTASALEDAAMEDNVDIGPFSHLRPGAYLESGVHVGNFAEVKQSRIGSGAAMGHFGYVGDASIGAGVNLGAGMVTCNYDGKDKHRTVVETGAFIGCDTMLVAPVTVGAGAITGAGSVVTRDVPAGRLAVGVPAKIKVKDDRPD
jgi:bifunctional UDP-N-acetylglucosamine pyrophosphorylase/glucosamine-1-phosphate N-acetyltransferase